jgi:hypothetical protein
LTEGYIWLDAEKRAEIALILDSGVISAALNMSDSQSGLMQAVT